MANLDESNVDEAIDRAIDKYWKKGMVVDAIFWSKVISILRDKIKKLKPKRMIRAGSSGGKSTGLKHQGSESR